MRSELGRCATGAVRRAGERAWHEVAWVCFWAEHGLGMSLAPGLTCQWTVERMLSPRHGTGPDDSNALCCTTGPLRPHPLALTLTVSSPRSRPLGLLASLSRSQHLVFHDLSSEQLRHLLRQLHQLAVVGQVCGSARVQAQRL